MNICKHRWIWKLKLNLSCHLCVNVIIKKNSSFDEIWLLNENVSELICNKCRNEKMNLCTFVNIDESEN